MVADFGRAVRLLERVPYQLNQYTNPRHLNQENRERPRQLELPRRIALQIAGFLDHDFLFGLVGFARTQVSAIRDWVDD